ncbi:hypothetical protein B4135_1600 [Caldibacillus debilis]|uniref:Uncharacterized protein n=1 Tax=Caldibacillus debilis TaxID=301148 RepID=A0A150MBP7_9BACI|nr:hypothetical protein B4135_1600 [Caldibacillus debilis]
MPRNPRCKRTRHDPCSSLPALSAAEKIADKHPYKLPRRLSLSVFDPFVFPF